MSIGSFSGLNLALSGLLAQQRALDVTAHNVANAETPGYSRQEAVLATRESLYLHSGATLDGLGAMLGQGVDVAQYRRLRDDFIDTQWRGQNMSLGANEASADRLGQVEAILKEDGAGGIGTVLDTFFSAWQDLANHPEDSAAKAAVLQHAQTLAQAFNTADADLAQVATDATGEVASLLGPTGPIQGIATELATLNDAIRHATQAGVNPNDQLDRRDQLLDQLSTYGQVSVTPDATPGNEGMVVVSFGGASTPFLTGTTATVPTPADLTTPGGRLGALATIAGTTIPAYRATLDAVAAAITGAVNGAHPTAVFSGTSAATLTVAASPGSIVAGTGGAGDNAVARAIAALRTGADASLGGQSITQAYAGLVGQIGHDVATARTAAATSDAVVSSLTERRQSVAGVSMDEEMTNMVRFQRGYQAAARALTTMDEALDTLINRTGRVGL